MNPANLRIVLVGTAQPGNIGAAARAIKTMGLHSLHLVAPMVRPGTRASWRAAAARDVLDAAVMHDTLAQALAPCTLVAATSARSRRLAWPVHSPRRAAARLAAQSVRHPVALVFGREDSGLTNGELQQCHLHIQIPSDPSCPVLNLAAAVQLMAWEIRLAALGDEAEPPPPADEPPAPAAQMEQFYTHLEKSMVASGFHDPSCAMQTMARLRRLFQRAHPDQMELQILRGFLRALDPHLPDD